MVFSAKSLDIFLNPYEAVKMFGLREGMHAADFGSGAGHFVIAMAHIVGNKGAVSAVDIRPDMLEILRGHEELDKLYQIETVQGDLEKKDGSRLTEKSQDLVLCSNILHQVDGKLAVLQEARRVLKDDGRLIIIEWAENFSFGPAGAMRMTKNEAQKLAEEAGFVFKQEFQLAQSHYGLEFAKMKNN